MAIPKTRGTDGDTGFPSSAVDGALPGVLLLQVFLGVSQHFAKRTTVVRTS